MTAARATMLREQFDLTWALAEHHMAPLTDEDLLWAPTALHWTVRQRDDGGWHPDWDLTEDGVEPDPVPVPTAGWVSWHLGWWWSTTLDHLQGRTPRDREEVLWPGSAEATVAWLRGLRDRWTRLLDGLDDTALDAPAPFPWPAGSGRTVADTLAWANAELMKNVAELGQLRMLRAASQSGAPHPPA